MRKRKCMFVLLSLLLASCGGALDEKTPATTVPEVSLKEESTDDSQVSIQNEESTKESVDSGSASDTRESGSTSNSSDTPKETLVSTLLFQGETFSYPNEELFGIFVENDNGLTMTGFGNVDNIDFFVIPEEVNGKTVTQVSISDPAEVEKLNTKVKVVIPKTLQSIYIPVVPCWSILYCGNQQDWLSSGLGLNRKMEGIADLYFLEGKEFTLVKDLVIEEGTEEIPAFAFAYTSIETLKLPSSVKVIKGGAFAYCGYLNTIELNPGLEEVGIASFEQCNRLLSLSLPSSLKKLSSTAFGGENLLSVEVEEGLTLTKGSLAQAFAACTKIYRFLNHSSEVTPTFASIQITTDNNDKGDIFALDGYYYGYVENELTMLTYLGEEKTLTLPQQVTYKDKTFTKYVIGIACFYHYCFAASLHPDMDYDYLNPLPVLESISVPSCVTDILGKTTFSHYVKFTEERYGLKEIYFDMDQEKVSSFACIKNIHPDTKVYYKTADGYALLK
ncbi:MAG: leucine-rich repeat domain-containing protein [Bacilli bacterium]|nr:leucine-rich repeat domain-containing protein [Bacilli bacterium]